MVEGGRLKSSYVGHVAGSNPVACTVKIALDVESVLANTNEAALQSTDKLDRDHLLGEWNLSDHQWQVYMGVSDAIWRHKPEAIPPEETHIDRYVGSLREKHEVHILTGREHVDPQIQWWLDQHGIEYDSFESTPFDKCTYSEFDWFIDDNPEMAGGCPVFLRHQPWNAAIDESAYPDCYRVHSLAEVEPILDRLA